MQDGGVASGGRTAVVVGGGIGGLGAARALQGAGWSVRVLERADRLEPVGAGISLWPNAVHALAALGVALPVPATPTGAGGVRTARGRWPSRNEPAALLARHGAPLIALHRGQLQEALLGSLPAGTVVTGARVHRVQQQPGHVTVEHSRGSDRADLAVLADGLSSPTRQLVAGPRPRARYAGYTAWRGVAGPDGPGPALQRLDGATESWGRGQRFGIVPLVDGRTYWFATADAPEGERAPGGEHADLLRRFAGWHEPIGQVLAATDPGAVLRRDVFDLRPAPATYVRGRLVLLGDAAHAMTPDLGQGACQALEDAATLGALLPPGSDLHPALARYDALRRPRAQGVARRSRGIGRLGQLRGRGTAAVRDLLLAAVPAAVTDRGLDATVAWRPPAGEVMRS